MEDKPTVLVVDDTPENLFLVSNLLKDNYKVKVANNGDKALRISHSETPPDLILLDIMMPEMDGYEVCKRLKLNTTTKDIPIIFLTAKTDPEDEEKGLDVGAVDYISKPINPRILIARVNAHIHLKLSADFLKDKNSYLEMEVVKRTREIRSIQEVTIIALASLAETRDNETGNHLRRTQLYVKSLALALQKRGKFTSFLNENNIELLYKSAPLHDIGKVGIPDHILLKQGKLTPEEFEIMKSHVKLGREAIERAEQALGTKVDFLQIAKDVVLYHHEKWDGSGYPESIAGENIPIAARLMAIADVYDALISRRVYKEPFSHLHAVEVITQGKGIHFDPTMVEVFEEIKDEFQAIASNFPDESK